MARRQHGGFEEILRGGQTVGHTWDMTLEVLAKLFLFTIVPVVLLLSWAVIANLSSEQQVAGLEIMEARVFASIGSPLPQTISVKYPDNQSVVTDVAKVPDDPFVKANAAIFFKRIWAGVETLICCIILIGLGAVGWFRYVGKEKIKPRKIRGQEVISAPALVAQIEQFNAQQVRANNLANFVPPRLIGVPYPYEAEREHTMICGAPGTGKSVAIHQLLDSIRARGDRAIILDPELDFLRYHYNPDTDLILNPFDKRSPGWSPFNDARDATDWTALAHTIFKEPKSGDPYWVTVARSIFVWTAYQLSHVPGHNNLDSLLRLLFGPPKDLKALLDTTPAAMHLNSLEGARVSSLLSVVAEGVEPLIYLHGSGDGFSIKSWVNRPQGMVESQDGYEVREPGGFLFFSAPDNHMDALRPLLGFWSELTVGALLSRDTGSSNRPNTWIILDEFHSIGRIDKLADGPQRLRKYGGCVVLGFQQISQLFDLYGPDKARTIIGQCKNKLVLGAADFETAEHMSDQLGRTQWRRTDENISYGANSIRDGVSLISKEDLEPIFLPEDVLNFVKFQGVIRVANSRRSGAFPIAPIMVPLISRKEIAPGIEMKDIDPVKSFLSSGGLTRPIQPAKEEPDAEAPAPPTPTRPAPQNNTDLTTLYGSTAPLAPMSDGAADRHRIPSKVQDVSPAKAPAPPADDDETGDSFEKENDPNDTPEDGDTAHQSVSEMRARLQDRPGEEAERQRRREEEDEEARRDMLTNAARRDPEPDRGVTSWMQRQLDFSREGEGEELGSLERAEKAEIEHAQHHQHDGLVKGGELILSFLAGGEISLASDAAPQQDREPQSEVTDSQTSDSGAASSRDGRADTQDHAPSISAPLDTRTDGVELSPDVIHDPDWLHGHQRHDHHNHGELPHADRPRPAAIGDMGADGPSREREPEPDREMDMGR